MEKHQKYCVYATILGYSRYGKVYMIQQMSTKTKMAGKKYDRTEMTNQLFQAMKKEGELTVKIKSPYVVQTYKYIEKQQNSLFIIMELCQTSLKSFIFSSQNAHISNIQYFKKIFRVYLELISLKIVFRDITPARFLIKKGILKITGFGYAIDTNTQNGTFKQKSPYMSPQILMGNPYTAKTDIWSLGINLYWLCFKKLPWGGFDQNYIIRCQNPPDFPDNKKITEKQKKLILRCLVFNENQRATPQEIYEILYDNFHFVKNQFELEIKNKFQSLFHKPGKQDQYFARKFKDYDLAEELEDPWQQTNKILEKIAKIDQKKLDQTYQLFQQGAGQEQMCPKAFHSFIQMINFKDYDQNTTNHLIQQIDKDNNGAISLQEIKQAISKRKEWKQQRKHHHIEIIFKRILEELIVQKKKLRTFFTDQLGDDQDRMNEDEFISMIEKIQKLGSNLLKLELDLKKSLFEEIKQQDELLSFKKFKQYFVKVNSIPYNFEDITKTSIKENHDQIIEG